MSNNEAIGHEIVDALKARIGRRAHRQTRNTGATISRREVIDLLIRQEVAALTEQESAYREKGDEATADAFTMVRTQLLMSIVPELHEEFG